MWILLIPAATFRIFGFEVDVATDGVLRERETVRLRLFIGAFAGRGRRRMDGLIWDGGGPYPADVTPLNSSFPKTHPNQKFKKKKQKKKQSKKKLIDEK